MRCKAKYILTNSVTMESNNLYKRILSKYDIKPCLVKLTPLNTVEFKKIKIKCKATSSDKNEKLLCDIGQQDGNTFSIKIKRLRADQIVPEVEVKPKKVKFSEPLEIANHVAGEKNTSNQ